MAWSWTDNLKVTGDLMNTHIEDRLQALEAQVNVSFPPWVPIQLTAGVTTWKDTNWSLPAYQIRGNMVYLRGLVHTLVAITTTGTQLFSVPDAAAVPPDRRMFAMGLGGTSVCRVDMRTDGGFYVGTNQTIPTDSFIMLDGVSYTIDDTL